MIAPEVIRCVAKEDTPKAEDDLLHHSEFRGHVLNDRFGPDTLICLGNPQAAPASL